uniref:Uncharacterized protein n=1 Tax=Lepeophtheirus salmonis TaxID=72036 RepID=A0A0K2UII3_LEPSM
MNKDRRLEGERNLCLRQRDVINNPIILSSCS